LPGGQSHMKKILVAAFSWLAFETAACGVPSG